MQCPFCGKAMEYGMVMAVGGRRSIFGAGFLWAPAEYFKKHSFNPFIRPGSVIKKEGGVKVEIYWSFGSENDLPEAYYCRGCQKILADFIGH